MKYLFCFFLSFFAFISHAEDDFFGIGEWKFHFPYKSPIGMAIAENRTYVHSENGIFFIDKTDNSLQTLTTKDGLSDIQINKIAYNSSLSTLVIGYKSGKIDLIIDETTIISIDDIYRSNIIGSKAINHIFFHDDIAYISTDFGLIQLDIVKYEVKDSYINIGENGIQIPVYSSTINSSSNEIFIVCSEGLKKAKFSSTINLLDPNNWSIEKDTSQKVSDISTLNNVTYAFSPLNNTIFYLRKTTWDTVATNDLLKGKTVQSFATNLENNNILLTFNNNLLQIKDTNSVSEINGSTWDPKYALFDNEGHLWINTYNEGVRSNFSGEWDNYYPNGPEDNRASHFFHDGDTEYILRGGYYGVKLYPNWANPFFYTNKNQEWATYDPKIGFGLVDMVIHPTNNHTYFASFGDGIVYQKPDGTYDQWKADETNTLQKYNRVSSIELDNEYNMWITSYLATGSPSLHKLTPDHKWTSYKIDHPHSDFFTDIVIDDYGVKWLKIKNGATSGIYIFDERINTESGRYLSNTFSSGNLPNNSVNDVKKDNNNKIWIATDNGIAVFDNQSTKKGDITTSEVFNSEIQARLPIISEQGLPILLGEVVHTICVDGANNKWVGTNNGLWLFNDNGTKVLKKFDESNSPLPTNQITTLDMNPETGILFIGTSVGVITYWDGTTEPKEEFASELKIFPNPVQISNNEQITIQGLVENSIVKITDITGRIISEKNALGGTVIWNGYDVNGSPAQTGIYLIYAVSEDGEESFVGKFALIE